MILGKYKLGELMILGMSNNRFHATEVAVM
jgi:hypothetical protein